MHSPFKEHEGALATEQRLDGRFCERPFELMEIHNGFAAYACCPSWQPTVIGNLETGGVMETWNSPAAQAVRAGILDGSFRHCDHRECPRIQAMDLPRIAELPARHRRLVDDHAVRLDGPPSQFALCYDDSCNLACPSCRRERIMDVAGEGFERKRRFTDALMREVEAAARTQVTWLRVTGSGDPFASKVFRTLLNRLDGRALPNLRIILQTNGVMLTEGVWEEMAGIHPNIHSISISIDAANAATYARTRRFGSWPRLLANLDFVAGLARRGMIRRLDCNFVVQTENFREMGDFVDLCTSHEVVDRIFFSLVNDWGTWSPEEYRHQCIWKSDHPEFDEFLAALRDPRLDQSTVELGNLTAYRKQALLDPHRLTS